MCVKSVKKADTFYLKFPEIHPYWLEEMRCCQEGERGAKWRVSNYTPSLVAMAKNPTFELFTLGFKIEVTFSLQQSVSVYAIDA